MKILLSLLCVGFLSFANAQTRLKMGNQELEVGTKTATLKLTSHNNQKKIPSGRMDYYLLEDASKNVTITHAKYTDKNLLEAVYVYKLNLAELDNNEYTIEKEQTIGSYLTPIHYAIYANCKTGECYKVYEYADVGEASFKMKDLPASSQESFKFSNQKKAAEWAKKLNAMLNK